VSEAFDTVVGFLRADGWPVALSPDGDERVATKFQGAAGIWICEGRVDPHERVIFYSVAPEPVPETRRAAVSEYLTRAKAGLAVGNFELDLDDGQLRFKTSLDFEGEPLSATLVRNLIYANVRAMDHFAPGLAAAMEGG